MAELRWERLAAATGIVFVVLSVIALVAGGQAPRPDDPDQEIVSYFVDNRSGLLFQAYLFGLASIFFLWFVGSLRSHLRRAEGETGRLSAVAFGGGVATVATFFLGTSLSAALAFRVAQTDPGVAVALFHVGSQAFTLSSFTAVVLVAAASVVIIRTGALPSWLGWLGGLLSLAFLVSGFAVFVESGPLASGGAYGYIVFGVFFLWVLLASMLLVQRVGRPAG